MRINERAGALSRANLFAGLKDAALLQIARSVTLKVLPAGGSISLPCTAGPLHLIVSGSAHLALVSAGGREFILSIAGRGEVLGEMDVTETPKATSASAQLILTAREPTHILCIPWAALHRNVAPADLARRCIVLLAQRAAWMLQVIEDLALHPLDVRLARLLVRLHARAVVHPVARLHRFDQSTLALMANASRPKVNQHLQRFRRLGAIALERGAVRMLNPDSLAEITEHE